MDDVKRGILCLLFGGTLPDVLKKSRKNKRVPKSGLLNKNNKNNKNSNSNRSNNTRLETVIEDEENEDNTYNQNYDRNTYQEEGEEEGERNEGNNIILYSYFCMHLFILLIIIYNK